jgi:hypothetical protein
LSKPKNEERAQPDYSPKLGVTHFLCFEPRSDLSMEASRTCLEELADTLRLNKLEPVWRASDPVEGAPLDRIYVAINPIHYSAVRKKGQRIKVNGKSALNHRSVSSIYDQSLMRREKRAS